MRTAPLSLLLSPGVWQSSHSFRGSVTRLVNRWWQDMHERTDLTFMLSSTSRLRVYTTFCRVRKKMLPERAKYSTAVLIDGELAMRTKHMSLIIAKMPIGFSLLPISITASFLRWILVIPLNMCLVVHRRNRMTTLLTDAIRTISPRQLQPIICHTRNIMHMEMINSLTSVWASVDDEIEVGLDVSN